MPARLPATSRLPGFAWLVTDIPGTS